VGPLTPADRSGYIAQNVMFEKADDDGQCTE
jgi:hypothetical protein